jgi:hypothetical protein
MLRIAALPLASALLAAAPALGAQRASAPIAAAEIFPLAYQRLARRSCRLGVPGALERALADTRAVLHELAPAQRAAANGAVDSAYAATVRDGGCASLARPVRVVVVDRFEGHPWGAPLSEVGARSKGTYDDEGFFTLVRGTKLAGVKGEATYTFTGARGRERLVRGRLRLHVSHDDRCARRWLAVEGALLARHPTLRVARPAAPPSSEAACAARPGWATIFRNPDTSALEARMTMTRDDRGRAVIVVDYPGLTMR